MRRVALSAGALFLIYLALSFALDPRAFFGTDTGGKVATLELMTERGDLDPDIGYWAADFDEDSDLHPFYYTSVFGERWVNVTTLPALYAAVPLYDAWGYRGALVLPMIGGVLVALAARSLARRLRPGDEGWAAFWLIGLASPVVIYSLDFWEHTLGLAVMAWGVVALVDACTVEPVWWRGGLAGLAFGVAATMRTEALVYGAAVTAVTLVVLLHRDRALRVAARFAGASLVGAFVPLALNQLLEIAAVGEPLRAGRTTSIAAMAGSDSVLRVKEAVAIALNIGPSYDAETFVVSGLLAAALVAIAFLGRSSKHLPIVAVLAVLVGLIYWWRLSPGVGWVPGLLAASPIAAIGLADGWGRFETRFVLALALAPLPVVWVVQYSGGALPQWAGRYILLTGLLLAVVGVVELPTLERLPQVGFVVLAVVITASGVWWLSVRTHAIAAAGVAFNARPEPVLVSEPAHLPRELGTFYGDKRWLSTPFSDQQIEAAAIVDEAGFDQFGLVQDEGDRPPAFEGWVAGDTEVVDFVGDVKLQVTTYHRDG